MGKGKPRHNPEKPENRISGHCPYHDGTRWNECGWPWANKCNDDRHQCRKLYLQHLATLSEKERDAFTEKYGSEIGVPRTNLNQIKEK